jgi:hypothetical protein
MTWALLIIGLVILTVGLISYARREHMTEEFLTVWPVTTLDWRGGHFLT